MKTQEQMMEQWLPVAKTAPIYKKTATVKARLVGPGVSVTTTTSDGKETQMVSDAEYNVLTTNPGGEQYLVKQSKFEPRYLMDNPLSHDDQVYQAKGRIKGVVIPKDTEPFEFVAAWGEAMVAKPGDTLAVPINDDNELADEIYRIAKLEFEQTYGLE